MQIEKCKLQTGYAGASRTTDYGELSRAEARRYGGIEPQNVEQAMSKEEMSQGWHRWHGWIEPENVEQGILKAEVSRGWQLWQGKHLHVLMPAAFNLMPVSNSQPSPPIGTTATDGSGNIARFRRL